MNTQNRPKIPWDKVDWRKQDRDIARETGTTHEAARLARRRLGMPNAINHGRQHPQWTNEEIMLLGKFKDSVVAENIGRPISMVSDKRQELKIPAIWEAEPERIRWPKWAIKMMGTVSDQTIATKLGVSLMPVCRKRQSLGIEPRYPNRGRRAWRTKGAKKNREYEPQVVPHGRPMDAAQIAPSHRGQTAL